MKLMNAIKLIKEREKRKRKEEIEQLRQKAVAEDRKQPVDQDNLVRVQTILPQDDVAALKAKTGENSVKKAIAKAVCYYLKTVGQGD